MTKIYLRKCLNIKNSNLILELNYKQNCTTLFIKILVSFVIIELYFINEIFIMSIFKNKL